MQQANTLGAAAATRDVSDFKGCGVEVINPWSQGWSDTTFLDEVINLDIELTDLDQQVKMSFDNFVNEALRSVSLGKIARQPMGACEATMSDQSRDTLDDQFGDGARVLREENRYYPNGNRYRHDIVVEFNSGKDGVMEVKTPFTNHDGITNKTPKAGTSTQGTWMR